MTEDELRVYEAASPSLRRVWVEIAEKRKGRYCVSVTLLAEGVG